MIKKSGKSNRKSISCIVIFCLTLMGSMLMIGFIRNLPVDWDAGACRGGYSAFIFDKYSDSLTHKFVDGSMMRNEIISAEAVKGTQEAKWKGNTIFLRFDVRYENTERDTVTETVSFVGKRKWFDTYDWVEVIVDGE